MKKITNTDIDGQKLVVNVSQQGTFNPNTSIFIKNLHENVTEKNLIDVLSACGLIISCMVNINFLLNLVGH